MSKLADLTENFRINNWLVWGLNQLFHHPREQHLVISSIQNGETATQQLLSAYAGGIRHFPGSILEQAELYQTRLPNIILTAARLREADICEADLMGADFRHADLRDASLIESNLVGANFSGSDLTGAWHAQSRSLRCRSTVCVFTQYCSKWSGLSRCKPYRCELGECCFGWCSLASQ